jgi:cellulose synthase operon protein YhjU
MRAPSFGWKRVHDRLGAWNFYFIAKAALFALGLVDFHLVANLAFAAALAAMAHPRTRALRPWLAAPVAIALLYYDSRLPGLARVMSQAGLVASFSGAYLVELAGRFFSAKVIAILAAAIAAFALIARFVRIDVFVAAGMAAIGLWIAPREAPNDAMPEAPAAAAGAPSAAQTPDAMVTEFFRREAQRQVAFAPPSKTAPPFDVIFVHVCSLSWDDLAATGLDKHALLASFDIVLERFNSVSTYSGPAAIRLLRAPCGQPRHDALYRPAPPQCLLLPSLQEAGLEPQLAMNHDGHFDRFLDFVREQGVLAVPLSLKGIDAPQRGFDDSHVYDDAGVLARWLEARLRSPAQRVALYYNTLSLHDGNHLVTQPNAKSSETYKARLAKLLDELAGFIDEIGASGRRAVVVLIPEHGAALRGDSTQIPGLREIPTPAITLVPVGIRVVGPDAQRVGEAVHIAGETSFLAVSHIVAAMLAKPPFGSDGFKAKDYVDGLPLTPYVSEGEAAMVIHRGNAYLLRQERDAWKELR